MIPTEPGFYWLNDGLENTIVSVYRMDDGLHVREMGYDVPTRLDHFIERIEEWAHGDLQWQKVEPPKF
jgi:hypothetical protein